MDQTVAAQLTAIVAGLIPEVQAVLDRDAAKDKTIADLQAQLGQAQSDATAAQQQEVTDTASLSTALDSLKTLVEGPTTPDVTPVPPSDVPDVLSGNTPVTDSSGDPVTVTDGSGASQD